MDINEFMRSFSDNQLKEINDFLNSAQGHKLRQNISEIDKAELLKKLSQLQPDDVRKSINGVSKDAILRMLK